MSVSRTELNPVDFLHRTAYIHPDAVAVVTDDGRRISYGTLGRRANQLANALRGRGLEKADRIAVLCPNSLPILEAHFAVPAAGGILVAINTRLSTSDIGYILEHCGARTLLVDRELLGLVAPLALDALDVIEVADTGEVDDPYEQLVGEGSMAPPASWLDQEEETISINYTSGTTGQPKGVQYTYRGAYLNALGEVIVTGLTNSSRYLWTLPMFHCNGWCFPWAVTAAGGRHVTLRRVDPDRIWELIDAEGVTHYNGAPTVHTSVVNHPAAHRLASPVTVTVAAAPPSPTLLGRLESLNFRVVHVYGLTETYGPITVFPASSDWQALDVAERARMLARQGQGYPTAELVRVVDGEDRDVPRDGATIGEVVMRGNNVMSGYYADPDATAQAFRGGWFHSGDLAVWHPDGLIELRDRAKDIIISGGENISTIEVEQTLLAHPAVLECAVVAVPHEHWGERPKAFVTLRDDAMVTADDLIGFARARIAHYKCPDTIEFGPLPKTSTGKVQKFVLREREWGGHDKRIN
jgi:fatty-acyl-CoA synthase